MLERTHLVARGGQLFAEYSDDSPLSLLGPGEVVRAGRIEPVPGTHRTPSFQVELSTELASVLALPSIVYADEHGQPFMGRATAEAFERRCVEEYLTRLAQPKP